MDKIMNDKLLYIPNAEKQNNPLCRFKALVEKCEHCLFEQTTRFDTSITSLEK